MQETVVEHAPEHAPETAVQIPAIMAEEKIVHLSFPLPPVLLDLVMQLDQTNTGEEEDEDDDSDHPGNQLKDEKEDEECPHDLASCQCWEEEDEDLTLCFLCEKTNPEQPFRMPHPGAGWFGYYCSWDCVMFDITNRYDEEEQEEVEELAEEYRASMEDDKTLALESLVN
jgi:hypothetical protein